MGRSAEGAQGEHGGVRASGTQGTGGRAGNGAEPIDSLEAAQRVSAFSSGFTQPPRHLRSWKEQNAYSISVAPENLQAEPRAAFARLSRLLTEQGVNRMVNALVIGHGGIESGLEALSQAWLDMKAQRNNWPPLSLQQLSDLGKVVCNDPNFSTLLHLSTLAGVVARDYSIDGQASDPMSGRGLMHPEKDRAQVRPWIDPTEDGLSHLDGWNPLLEGAKPGDGPAGYLDYLRGIQAAYDARHAGSEQATGRLWPGSTDPGFAATYALREAFWLVLQSAGLTKSELSRLPFGAAEMWSLAANQVPGLKSVDFAELFPKFHAAVRPIVDKAMREYDPARAGLELRIAAVRLAERTFQTSHLKEQFYEEVLGWGLTAKQINELGQNLQVDESARILLMERLLMNSGLSLSWLENELLEGLEKMAETIERASPQEFPSERAVLEQMLPGGSFAQARDSAILRLRQTQNDQEALLERIAERVIEFRPPDAPDFHRTIHRSCESLHGAVGQLLGRAGILVLEEPGPPGSRESELLVLPMKKGGTTEAEWALAAEEKSKIQALMPFVVQALEDAGYPTTWKIQSAGD